MSGIINRFPAINHFKLACIILILGLSIALPGSALEEDGDESKVPFSEFADAFLKTHGFKHIPRAPESFGLVLEQGYVAARLGAVDLWYPRPYLRKRIHARTFKEVAAALLDMQAEWIGWVTEKEEAAGALKEMKTLQKWVKAWNFAKVGRGSGEAGARPDLLDLMKVNETTRSASEKVSRYLTSEIGIGRTRADSPGVRMILCPTRGDVLELGCFIGTLSHRGKDLMWKDNLAYWTSMKWSDYSIIALEHPLNAPGKGDITQGQAMNQTEKTGLLEHVVQHAMEDLLRFYYGGSLNMDLAKGMAINMVIALYGQNNVRAGGGRGGKMTPGGSVFVAGAATDGKLPFGFFSKFRDSRWRETKGKDHFKKVLRDALKKGAKAARKSKTEVRDVKRCFALEPREGAVTPLVVEAPFLDSRNPKPDVPDPYRDDLLEFLRAYRSGFAYWLGNKAKSRNDESSPRELLMRLLRTLGQEVGRGFGNRFDQAVLETYGIPLSPGADSLESLEGEFIDWLEKGR
jgi:hypothetical protein